MSAARGIRVGIIGVGQMGQHHVRILSSLPGVSLVGLADADEEKLKILASRYSVKTFVDYHGLLPLIDAVCVASPTSTHHVVALDCLTAGLKTFVEKPLALTSSQALELVNFAAAKNLLLAVGFIERFNPAFQALAKLIKKEKIIGAHFQRFSPFPERISDADVVQDMMIHDLDLFLTLFPNETIEQVKAVGKKVKSAKLDNVSATIFCASGVIVKVDASRVSDEKTRKIVVTTDNFLAEADLLNKRVYLRDLKHHIPSTQPIKQIDQLTVELNDFIKAAKTGSPPTVTAEAGYRAQKFAEEVIAAC
jgi:virulence factor